MKRRWQHMAVKFFLIALVIFTALSTVVMTLWNGLVPEIFRGPSISFWQAAGLLLLSHILLRGWSPWGHGSNWKHDRWRRRMEERLASMSPEERDKFRTEWQHCVKPEQRQSS
jgi:hypothetical protein